MVPGLFVTERNIFGFGVSNGGAGAIKIRGVGGNPTNAVLMMVDGQPQFAGIYSHHVADIYETEYVDRVEVLRGPGSVLYGSNAMGGVINVITKNSDTPGCHTTLRTGYGSYNTWRSSVTNMTRSGKFSSLVSLAYDRTDGIERNFDFDQKSLYAKVGYDFSENWQARADYSLVNSIGNDPIYPRLSDPASTAIYHQNIIRGEASVSLVNSYTPTNGNVRLYYSYGNHYIDDPRHFHSLDDRFGVLAYQNFSLWKGADATAGFDFDTYTGRIPVSGGNQHTPGSLSTIGHKSITEYSPYVTLSQSIADGVLVLNGGLRMANSDKFGTQWIPQCGFSLHPIEQLAFKASAAKGYRNPSFRELYLYRTANPDLSPEQMTNYEATLSANISPRLTASLTAYYSTGDNLIQTVAMKNVNTGSFTNKGVEASATMQLLSNFAVSASYSYLHTSLANLVAAPANQFYASIAWQPVSRLSIDATFRGVSGLYVSPTANDESYILLGAKVSYTLLENVKGINSLQLFTTFDNITDSNYTINEGYKMPGFNAFGGLKLQF
jgi:iron complex outermembrane receptor protein